jgi:hypothetical protein
MTSKVSSRGAVAADGRTVAWGEDTGVLKVWDIKADREVSAF